jgi:hypothetical protein
MQLLDKCIVSLRSVVFWSVAATFFLGLPFIPEDGDDSFL